MYVGGKIRRASLLAGGATPVAVVVVTALLESLTLLGEGLFMFSHSEHPNLMDTIQYFVVLADHSQAGSSGSYR